MESRYQELHFSDEDTKINSIWLEAGERMSGTIYVLTFLSFWSSNEFLYSR